MSASTYTHNKFLTWALIGSVVAHAALLLVNFGLPDAFKIKPKEPALEVILVNARTHNEPNKADALAQVSLDGGGDREKGRAQSPLPDMKQIQDGTELQQTQKRVMNLESVQKKLVAQAVASTATVKPDHEKLDEPPTPNTPKTLDSSETAQAILRMEAQVSKQVEDYNKRPRVKYYAPSTSAYVATLYVENWRNKIERWGNLYYPAEAKGKLYGKLTLTVHIDKEGQVANIELDQSSGSSVLDQAAMNTVRRAGPYGKFSAEMAKQMDVLAITRTWLYTNDALETSVNK